MLPLNLSVSSFGYVPEHLCLNPKMEGSKAATGNGRLIVKRHL